MASVIRGAVIHHRAEMDTGFMIRKGDHVTIGETGKIHWIFQYFDKDGMVVLMSPMSGRRKRERSDRIRLYARGEDF